ncbi:3-hydroxyisobutyrate dehydrogenase mitochondrial [Fasciola hepatica]|uniref:3-hydroxyisobutyrate dehydrogenase n=1 Tax=Fasciola hepatica TaxID=6192 RepID=A0A4E0S1F8_FASHE|nr:3-hydroxyisobutyrate dehydrogenase mitochondrial [Fasciola hepatica]
MVSIRISPSRMLFDRYLKGFQNKFPCSKGIFRLMASDSSAVGFIGLGNMGSRMAVNLVNSGYAVHVFDKSLDGIRCLKVAVGVALNKHVTDHDSLVDLIVTTSLSLVVTMLPGSPQVMEVYCDEPDGLLFHAKPNTLFIDCSTGDPEVAKRVSELALSRQCAFVDAPVSGGVLAAENAGLTFMVGGTEENVARASPVLMKMGKQIFHCGSVGAGLMAKICNNMLLAISMIGTSEAMALGTRLGLDPKILANVINYSSGRCWSSEVYNPVPGVCPGVPASLNYKGGFNTALMTKDLTLAQNASMSAGQATPLGSLALQIYRIMCSGGYSGKDFSSVYHFLSQE